MLEANPVSISKGWDTPVLKTNAVNGDGIHELMELIQNHYSHLNDTSSLKQKENNRYEKQVKEIVHNYYEAKLWQDEQKLNLLEIELSKAIEKRKSPSELADIIIKDE